MSFQDWEITFEERTEELVEDYGDSWRLKFDDNIEPDNPAQDWFQYIRGAFARFQCSKCKKTWPSRRVLVVFHFRLDGRKRKGTVEARRFRQECRRCQEAKMEEPQFDSDNIEVLLEKLVERIRMRCYRETLDGIQRDFRPVGRSEGPHESSHCEACLKGVCRKAE
ncbi:receptor-transporting protein 3-like isoform X2 [Alosa sapidissima]|uniref:receptor-transporting protein 3-like isoform X2 n=1 Tax=Alosa sapidissima TaxID=34773 RepID=UPI001C0927E0|nr:receptor-transporting protein 3-like isoform X2 [Alosa sapidissima]